MTFISRLAGPAGRTLLVALAMIAAAVPATAVRAQGNGRKSEPLFTSRDLYWAGGFALGAVIAWPLDKQWADFVQGAPQTNRVFKRVSYVVENIADPGAFVIGGGLYAAGRLGHDKRMADLGLHGSEAIIAGMAVTNVIKFTVGRARPFVGRDPRDFGLGRGIRHSEYRSFPSGHTLIGFAAAAAVTDETRRWWPQSVWYIAPAMYGGASLIGLSRTYDNKHWLSDVMVGAAIGTFSGRKIVRYAHSHPNNKVDRWLLGVSLTETPGGRVATPIVGRGR